MAISALYEKAYIIDVILIFAYSGYDIYALKHIINTLCFAARNIITPSEMDINHPPQNNKNTTEAGVTTIY